VKSFAVLGLGMGAGAAAFVAGMLRRPPAAKAAPESPPTSSWPVRIGRGLTKVLGLRASARRPLRQDLNILGRSDESLAVATTVAALAGASGAVVVSVASGYLGLNVPSALVPLVCLTAGLAGACVPSLLLRRAAGASRRDLVRALACWLELVALAQAGGMGIESALETASSITAEASFLRIRRALDRARHAGRSPWDGLSRLGDELGVNELEELAASVRLAGTEGARIRSSLSAKSASLRRRQMADAQGRANATTEHLFLPAIVLMIGFVVFLLYPAAVTLSRLL
jgi:Flp pilus assembly protein TadB